MGATIFHMMRGIIHNQTHRADASRSWCHLDDTLHMILQLRVHWLQPMRYRYTDEPITTMTIRLDRKQTETIFTLCNLHQMLKLGVLEVIYTAACKDFHNHSSFSCIMNNLKYVLDHTDATDRQWFLTRRVCLLESSSVLTVRPDQSWQDRPILSWH